jgi:hypothetical protein
MPKEGMIRWPYREPTCGQPWTSPCRSTVRRLMQNKTGSIVAIEPSTGEILTLVSSPTYDPALLVGRIRSENFSMLQADTVKPLFDRALMASYPPGSTFKIMNGLIGLQENVIKPDFSVQLQQRVPCRFADCRMSLAPLPAQPAPGCRTVMQRMVLQRLQEYTGEPETTAPFRMPLTSGGRIL